MIEFKQTNIFDLNTEAITNTVNCVGVMGKGLALAFKNKYPGNFKFYKDMCMANKVRPGEVLIYPFTLNIIDGNNPKYIVNFPTKRHWKDNSILQDIEDGLKDLKNKIIEMKIESIAIPPLGCGLGGLNWNIVKEKIINELNDLDEVEIIICEP